MTAAGAPGAGGVFHPLPAQLLDGHVGAIFFKGPDGYHFVVPVVVNGSVVYFWVECVYPFDGCDFVLEGPSHHGAEDLGGPDGLYSVTIGFRGKG